EAADHTLEPERIAEPLRDLGALAVGAVKGRAQVLQELRPVGLSGCAELVEHLYRRTNRIVLGLQHEWRDRRDQHGLGDTLRTVPPDVARHLASARRVTYVDGVLQIERLRQLSEVVRIGVHV